MVGRNYPDLNIERWMTETATKHPTVIVTPEYTWESMRPR
jgi:hypothetical protein